MRRDLLEARANEVVAQVERGGLDLDAARREQRAPSASSARETGEAREIAERKGWL